ncbi:MAG: Na/Pi symporter [Pseudomonadales bacterium]|jgi:phosphate:Na+ symporter|nr:Na/Pi symporter [Pseudomonadales bacterium]
MTTAEILLAAGSFLGGLGLFLLAVRMLTDGLRFAAGDALRGVASGVLVTAIVQSSSAVTVATIGFVNAGLLTLAGALGVVYGANIGTTVTGWLVAAVGFEWKIDVFALPLIGFGMLLRLGRSASRLGALGEALAGFGLFFVGVDVLKTSFEGMAALVDPAVLRPEGWLGLAAFIGVGVLMTVLTQSSSAAIAITLTAATGGLIAIDAAAAAVIGANVGTTSTAVLAALGATASARRVAAAHVVFNVATAIVAILLLPLLLWIVDQLGRAAGFEAAPALTLALFHTVFNVLGVGLMLPVTGWLASFLAGRFVTEAERLGRPVHLDANVMETPELAMDALALELQRLLGLIRDWYVMAATARAQTLPDPARLEAVHALSAAIVAFLGRLERSRLTAEVARDLPEVLRVVSFVEEVTDATDDLQQLVAVDALVRSPLGADVERFRAEAVAILAACDPAAPEFDAAALRARREVLKEDWHRLKDLLLQAAAEGRVSVEQVSRALDVLRALMRVVEQLLKAARRVQQFSMERPIAGADASVAEVEA